MTPQQVPNAVFHTRIRNEVLNGPNQFKWRDLTTTDLFGDKNVIVFAVPGAFTPACSESHLPEFERFYDRFISLGIDEVICLSVNDAFTMFNWAKAQNIQKVFMLPDGNGEFTRKMGMLVERKAQGMGMRSWRYCMHVENKNIRKMFIEPGFKDEPSGVPVEVSGAETMFDYLTGLAAERD